MEPGVMPPMSAWCPLLATKNTGPPTPFWNTWGAKKKQKQVKMQKERQRKKVKGRQKWDRQTGVMTVRSGRWLPPAQGWLLRITSPSFKLFPSDLICTEKHKYTPLLRMDRSFFIVEARKHKRGTQPSPGTGLSPASPPGGQGCGVHWKLSPHLVQTQRRKSRGAP